MTYKAFSDLKEKIEQSGAIKMIRWLADDLHGGARKPVFYSVKNNPWLYNEGKLKELDVGTKETMERIEALIVKLDSKERV
jgi:hypothetical protein